MFNPYDNLAWCVCGCPFAAHRQQLGKARQDHCNDHGAHWMMMNPEQEKARRERDKK